MKIIITGSTGFVGSRVLHYLKQQDHQVSCVPSAMLRGELSCEQLSQLTDFFSEAKPDVVIHMAAIADTLYAEQYPEESYIANVKLPEVIAKLAKVNGCKLISCSSDQVYNASMSTDPNSENGVFRPINVYGRHKLEAEQRVLDIYPDAVLLRLTWMYDMPVYHMKTNNNIVLVLMWSAMKGISTEYSTNDFRGLTNVRSVAENLPKTFSLPGGVYNFGSENDKNMYETACGFMGAMGMGDRIPELIKPNRTKEMRNISMDCSKLRKYGIYFETTIDSIKKMVDDYPGLF